MNMYKTSEDIQTLELINSAQAFNISESRISEKSPMRLFEDEMKGNQMEAVIYKDTLTSAPSTAAPTPVGNWIEHLKLVFQDWPTINFWHVGFSGFIAPWEKLENIQSIPLLEMWERLNK